MFPNRPANQKDRLYDKTGFFSQNINKDLEKDFYLIRDAVQKRLLAAFKDDPAPENEAQLKHIIEVNFNELLVEQNLLYNLNTRAQLLAWVVSDIAGFGPLEPLLTDPEVTEIMVNGPNIVYVERTGLIELTQVHFENDSHLMRIIDRIVAPIGRRLDESMPMVDARLPNGFRVNATIPPLSLSGPILTIRKFQLKPFSVQDLIANGTLTEPLAKFIRACVEAKLNIVISGGTGGGKTVLLNVISSFIPSNERIITIEDIAEIQLNQNHVVRLEKRPPNIEGKGEITIRQLVINSLRMRPNRIVVGECRGGEAMDMLQAMNTGHDGSMTTIHANTPRDAMRRIESMVLMAGLELPLKAVREQVSSSINLIIHVERMKEGTRKVVQVTEVQGMEGENIILQDLFTYSVTESANGRAVGKLKPTGLRPTSTTKFIANNIDLPSSLFWTD
jgi:pilus assembly protein CpaF